MQVNSISCLSDQEKEGDVHVKDKIERQKSKKKNDWDSDGTKKTKSKVRKKTSNVRDVVVF